ncbi:bifunctional dTDP-4-dehydrorhamnose 3,5-epimerase family protein/NAD(P)-dependent oxidoreductase [Nocardioides abyssi]|uniref:dTDP-4-dehydrorhamnose reductase n=1 Tax=Nocardioides abyssi TaxID=3058370 RepID=A0ABT8EWG7_9ACTN|nr:bifunctional dTDP-4-dehydrorhamnose 3,5-epimerase family protein/NAD(P)-dependent oxidoreductase [Nocardioides abyssi]MDN4162485.1 bifunctional dTDP-4-dehydrorhamnose 3,5-epimerase family protein/NAD(P)-dependent oxidoreductase [Nocardioides abyssi]
MRVDSTDIPGLLLVHLDVHEDARGWFKENWQRRKLTDLGFPDLGPVQHNVAHNHRRGTLRGVHAEPWDKLISVVTGRVFGAYVDLRAGDSFGRVVTVEADPSVAVLVPRGVGNAYQTLEDDTSYSYLVNDHWSPDATYVAVDAADPALAIPWPIPVADSVMSEKDRANPRMAEVEPMPVRRPMVLGANGQLGRALADAFPDARQVTRDDVDLTDPAAVAALPWRDTDVVLNAAAYTAVDAAETADGRRAAWAANASLSAALARLAREHRCTLVHYSTDYVFDGTTGGPDGHTEDEPLSPLGVYAQSKAAGDLAVGMARRHYVLRTSWVVGDGHNFVRTMQRLAADGVSPAVVDDQVGRLTFTDELVRATRHLLDTEAPYGTYNVSNSGEPTSWHDVAREVFRRSGRDESDVSPTSTAAYGQEMGQGRQLAPRPSNSVLNLSKIRAVGFEPEDAMTALERYLRR